MPIITTSSSPSVHFFFLHLTKIVHFYHFRNVFLNAFLNLSRHEKRQVQSSPPLATVGVSCVCGDSATPHTLHWAQDTAWGLLKHREF